MYCDYVINLIVLRPEIVTLLRYNLLFPPMAQGVARDVCAQHFKLSDDRDFSPLTSDDIFVSMLRYIKPQWCSLMTH